MNNESSYVKELQSYEDVVNSYNFLKPDAKLRFYLQKDIINFFVKKESIINYYSNAILMAEQFALKKDIQVPRSFFNMSENVLSIVDLQAKDLLKNNSAEKIEEYLVKTFEYELKYDSTFDDFTYINGSMMPNIRMFLNSNDLKEEILQKEKAIFDNSDKVFYKTCSTSISTLPGLRLLDFGYTSDRASVVSDYLLMTHPLYYISDYYNILILKISEFLKDKYYQKNLNVKTIKCRSWVNILKTYGFVSDNQIANALIKGLLSKKIEPSLIKEYIRDREVDLCMADQAMLKKLSIKNVENLTIMKKLYKKFPHFYIDEMITSTSKEVRHIAASNMPMLDDRFSLFKNEKDEKILLEVIAKGKDEIIPWFVGIKITETYDGRNFNKILERRLKI